MKTEIRITGQISGNHTLKNAIACYDVREGAFYSWILSFPTKKEARKALWDAFVSLRRNIEPEFRNGMSGLRYHKSGSLYWDASKAEIVQ